MKTNDFPIDFVMTWVDDTDPHWVSEYKKYKGLEKQQTDGQNKERFRNWDNLKYWFRGVEKFAPWVNKVYLVTCGQIPNWLNLKCSKLVLVNHEDYIPKKYLPVFSSHPIELNLHRISDLSEHFVYFNDDIFILRNIDPSDFFMNGKPLEMAVEYPLYSNSSDSFGHILLNNSRLLNQGFDKRQVLKKNFSKWFNPVYGKYLLNNIFMMRFGVFSGIITPHFPSSLQKSKMELVWDEFNADLDKTCFHRFRSVEDVNQYIFRFWNIATGDFHPVNFDKYTKFIALNDDNISTTVDIIRNQSKKLICINDSQNLLCFDKAKMEINGVLNDIFPCRSAYEL